MNKKKMSLIIIITLVLLVITTIIIYIVNKDKKTEEPVKQVEKIDQMSNYDYFLKETATEYYKSLYNELKETLNKEEVNDEEYAKIVSRLFVTDLFTLDNKLTSSDIGGLQFIYTDFKEDFINIAKDSIYSTVKSNIYGDRKQELPVVKNVEVTNIKPSKFTYKDTQHDSYEVNIKIEYEKDLDYPETYNLTLIKNDKYMQVVSAK